MKNILIFEGAGWDKADTVSDVENYRIRTRIRNYYGRVIYLEMDTNYKGDIHVSHCFDQRDQKTNHTPDLSAFEGSHSGKKWLKSNILSFVNEKLQCNFDRDRDWETCISPL